MGGTFCQATPDTPGERVFAIPDTELVNLNLSEITNGLRDREFSCREYCESVIAASEFHESLNALTSHDWDRLMSGARILDNNSPGTGLLNGVPLVIKDNINTRHLPTTGATSRFYTKS